MAKQLFTNNAKTTLAGSILSTDTVLTVPTGKGGLFPNPSSGDWFKFTMKDAAGNIEICSCTARSGDTLTTIVRAQEGTTALAFAAGDIVELRLTKGTMEGLSQTGADETISGNKINSGTQTNNGAVVNAGTVTNNGTITSNGAVTNNSTVSHISTDAAASAMPNHDLYRNSASPAAADFLGSYDFNGNNASLAKKLYARIVAAINSAAAGAEAGILYLQTAVAGAITTVATFRLGVQIGSPAGGDKGAGTLNASAGLYVNGNPPLLMTAEAAGTVPVASIISASNVNLNASTTPTKTNEIYCPIAGTMTVYFEAANSNGTGKCQIYKNGVAAGTLHSGIGPFTGFSENISVAAGDLLQIYGWNSDNVAGTTVRQFIIKSATAKYYAPSFLLQ